MVLPNGTTGLRSVGNAVYPFRETCGDLSDCLVSREKAWLLDIWEPLHTKAPAPPKAQPYCCYSRTVIFYHFPLICSPWVKLFRFGDGPVERNSSPGHFDEWDKVETRLQWDDVVEFEGELFEITSGQVLWKARRWWMRRGARRVSDR